MPHEFCPGYPTPYAGLVAAFPGADVYPAADFRVEWGPIFHRGRLDGSARLLIIGQDPATEEDFTRRILVGVAGQRTQGLMTRIGIANSYVMINTFLYSVASQAAGERHGNDQNIAAYRSLWLDTLTEHNSFDAVITLGTLAEAAYATWTATPTGRAQAPQYHAPIMHPTYPESAAASGSITFAAAMEKLLDNWNQALPGLGVALTHTDEAATLTPYGKTFERSDLTPIPEKDLPPGLPVWVRSVETWSARKGTTAELKRATLTLTVPVDQRPWKSAQE
jgi:uracil-DNA glycosylase